MSWHKLTVMARTASRSLYQLASHWWVFNWMQYLSFLNGLPHFLPYRAGITVCHTWDRASLCCRENQWCTGWGWVHLEPWAVVTTCFDAWEHLQGFFSSSHYCLHSRVCCLAEGYFHEIQLSLLEDRDQTIKVIFCLKIYEPVLIRAIKWMNAASSRDGILGTHHF